MCAATAVARQAGPVVCWGSNLYGQCNPPSEHFAKVAAGYRFSLGINSNGNIRHWGHTGWGQNLVPAGSLFVQISAGYDHGLALDAIGQLYAWGGGDPEGPGQQGQGTVPIDPQGENIYTAISAGEGTNYALRTNGSIFAWGWNASQHREVPDNDIHALGFVPYIAVDAGGHHAVGLKADGTIRAWGGTPYHCSTMGIVPPELIGVKCLAVGAGHYSSWAIKTDRTIVRWGCFGCATNAPANIQGTASFVDGGYFHCYGLTTNGFVRAWGASGCTSCTECMFLGPPETVPSILVNAVVLAIAPGNSNEHNIVILVNDGG